MIDLKIMHNLFRTRHGVMAVGSFMLGLGSIGFCLGVAAMFMAAIGSGYGYSPLVWSPDGKWIAFGVRQRFDPSRTLFVVSSDGKHQPRKLVDTLEDKPFDQERISDLRWDAESQRIFFKATGGIPQSTSYYVVSIKDGKPVPTTEFPSDSPTAHDVTETECDRYPHVEDRAIANERLVQSACTHSGLDSGEILFHECYQELQVCDVNTGEMLWRRDKYPFWDDSVYRWREALYWATAASGLLGIGGVVVFAAGLVSLHIRRKHRVV